MTYRTKQKGRVDQSLTCLPEVNGGTTANNIVDAANNLKLVTNAKKNIPFGVAGINSNNKIDPAILPPGLKFDGSVNISGPISLSINQIQAYTITDYDINTVYTIAAIGGSVSRSGATVAYTAPGTIGNSGFTINGKTITIAIGTALVNTPSITSPSTGSSNLLGSLTILSTAFALSSGTDVHEGSDWQIALDVGFTSIVSQVTNDPTSKTSWNVNSLTPNTTFYVRVRYKGTIYGYSNWSSIINFTTKAVYAPSVEKAILVASDKVTEDRFGYAVAMDSTGTRVVIGAIGGDPLSVSNAGKAYIFLRTGTSWAQEAILSASDKASGDSFGNSVSISADGSRVIVGAYIANPAGITDAGKAYIFLRTDTSWVEEQILTASDKATNNHFGYAVAMDSTGTRVAIGSSTADVLSITDAGKSYIFLRTDTSWGQEAILTASDPTVSASFGSSVSIASDGSRVIIGSFLASPGGISQSGAAYIFLRTGTSWTQEQILSASDKVGTDRFGTSVAMDSTGTRVIIGTDGADVSGIDAAGKAYIFLRTGTSWTQEQILSASDKATLNFFGWSVGISNDGSVVIIGAHRASPGGISIAGAAYVFTRSGVSWTESTKLTASNKVAEDLFGYSSSISGDGSRCIIGAYNVDPFSIINAGSAYIYG